MRPMSRLALWACLVIAQGCRSHHEPPPAPPPTPPTATARPLHLAKPDAIEFEFGRPQATACNCFKADASAKEGGTCATPRFGSYLLALTWAPTFCRTHPDKEECEHLEDHFGATHLTIHGLWPQFTDAEAQENNCTYPAYCGGLCECQGSNAPSKCFPDPATIPPAMGTYGPGFVTDNFFLANHEWPKHGSCTGMDARSYFQSNIDALLSLPGTEGTPAAITNNIGGSVALDNLRAAFGQSDSVAFACDPKCNLLEVGVCFAVDEQRRPAGRMTCPKSVTGGNTNSCVGNGSQPRCPMVNIQAAVPFDSGGGGGGPSSTCGQPGQGPACTNDQLCQNNGWVRCARSGCCTTVPKR
ncbi:ribonuclease T2 family protein [Corallococcus sp. M7]